MRQAGWGWTARRGGHRLVYFFPVLWIILTAFKTHHDALAIPPKFLFPPTLENFVNVFSRSYIAGREAVAEPVSTSFSSTRSSSPERGPGAGHRHAGRLRLLALPAQGNDTYLFIILTTRMMPPIVVIIPIFLMFRVAGLSGGYCGIVLLYTAFNLPFAIWMMKSFFDELSGDVEDAARVDGSSETRVFFKICLPQVRAGLAATAVFGLILTWNEFLFALLLTGVETRTVPVAMAQTIGGDIGVRWGLLAAIETLFLIPVIVVTFLLQHQLLRGVTFGTIKR